MRQQIGRSGTSFGEATRECVLIVAEHIANEAARWPSNTATETLLLEKAAELANKRATEVGAAIVVPDFEDMMCSPGMLPATMNF